MREVVLGGLNMLGLLTGVIKLSCGWRQYVCRYGYDIPLRGEVHKNCCTFRVGAEDGVVGRWQ